MEVAGGTGNISLYEDQPLVHIHALFGDLTGATRGGHVNIGTTVFAMEASVHELIGEPPVFWGTWEATGIAPDATGFSSPEGQCQPRE